MSNESRQLTAFAVEFQRTKAGPWEDGVFIGKSSTDDDGIIIDYDGTVVEHEGLWNYRDAPYRGAIVFQEVKWTVKRGGK